MPQMAPMNWLFLFIFFSLIFMSFSLMNYFSFTYSPSISKTGKVKTQFNWKW
uniref:ATP synthase complex subunit 8 n=1 Tax=Epipedocera atra TaxID=2763313 RepID=A0A7G7WQ88_9CUCU|nr:ATP synthase F0 subunit 8 [Epipedocera atra]QNH68715.1 ATP synthase subunit 8 [Epipedocera atra]